MIIMVKEYLLKKYEHLTIFQSYSLIFKKYVKQERKSKIFADFSCTGPLKFRPVKISKMIPYHINFYGCVDI